MSLTSNMRYYENLGYDDTCIIASEGLSSPIALFTFASCWPRGSESTGADVSINHVSKFTKLHSLY